MRNGTRSTCRVTAAAAWRAARPPRVGVLGSRSCDPPLARRCGCGRSCGRGPAARAAAPYRDEPRVRVDVVRDRHGVRRSAPGSAARPRSRSSRSGATTLLDLGAGARGSAARCARPCRRRCRRRSTWSGSQSGMRPSTIAWTGSMWLPNAPASRIRSTRSIAVAVHQQRAAGVERGLGELDRAHVVLRDRELAARRRAEHVGEGAAVRRRCAACARPARRRSSPSVVIMPARYSSAITSMMPEPQTPVTSRRAGEARLVRPGVGADHLEARLERLRVDAHALDRAGRRALAAGDLRALERRAGRARRGEQALAVAEHDLGVGADVDEQRHLVAEVRRLGEHDARGVGADVAGDAGQHVRPRAAVHGDAELARRAADGARRWRARRARRRAASGRCPSRRWCMIGLPTSVTSRMSSRSTSAADAELGR